MSHVLTGCDANSCFFGKIPLYEELSRSAEACHLISKCGESLTLSDDALSYLLSSTSMAKRKVLLKIKPVHPSGKS